MKIYDNEMIEILKSLEYVIDVGDWTTLTSVTRNFKVVISQCDDNDYLHVRIEYLNTTEFDEGYVLTKFLNFDDFKNYCLVNYFKKEINVKKGLSNCQKLQNDLKNDNDYLLGWHSNIAMFIHDCCLIQDYNERNKLASMFMRRIFDIKYNWKKLMESGGKEK